MSANPSYTTMFTETGPITWGEVYLDEQSFLNHKNKVCREPYARVRLLIDTGSNISGIDAGIIDGLGLQRYSERSEVDGVGGIHQVDRYRCVLFLPIFGMKGLPMDVLGGDYRNSPYDGVIGRDVLQYCVFQYDGPSNTYRLEALDF